MPKTYLRHLYRDRRRLALAWVLLLASVAIADEKLPVLIEGVRTKVLAVVPLLLAIPLVTILAPKHRHWIEVVVLGTFLHLLLDRLLPGSIFDHEGARGSVTTTAIVYPLTLISTGALFYGRWSDRIGRVFRYRATAHLHSRLSPRLLWYGLVPIPGHLDRNPDAEVVSIEFADATRRVIRLVTWVPPRPAGETLLHIQEVRPFQFIRFRMDVVTGLLDSEIQGVTEIEIADRGAYRTIRVTHSAPALPPRRLVRSWLDDTLGRMMDARLNAVERNARTHCLRAEARKRAEFNVWYPEASEVGKTMPDPAHVYRADYHRRVSDRAAAANEVRAA